MATVEQIFRVRHITSVLLVVQQELVDLSVCQQQMKFGAFGSGRLSQENRASTERVQVEEVRLMERSVGVGQISRGVVHR